MGCRISPVPSGACSVVTTTSPTERIFAATPIVPSPPALVATPAKLTFMSAKYEVCENMTSVPGVAPSPAGFQNIASSPVTSLATAPPSAVLRGPIGIWSSLAPDVPLRPSEPAWALGATSSTAAASSSAVAA